MEIHLPPSIILLSICNYCIVVTTKIGNDGEGGLHNLWIQRSLVTRITLYHFFNVNTY